MEARVSEPLDLENIVLRAQFSCTGAGKITQFENPCKVARIQPMIEKIALFVFSKSWVGLVADTRLYGDLVYRVDNLRGSCRIG